MQENAPHRSAGLALSVLDLPQRRSGKAKLLWNLPLVTEAAALIRKGVSAKEIVFIKLSGELIARTGIKNPSLIVRERIEGMIYEEKILSKNGKPLEVVWYTADDGDKVVCVSEVGVVFPANRRRRRAEPKNGD